MKIFLMIIGGVMLICILAILIVSNWGGSANDIPMDDYDQMP